MIKTVSHIILSVLILILSVGVTISTHYSNGMQYSKSLFGDAEKCNMAEAEDCTMQDMMLECELHNKNESKKNSCSCEDSSEYIHFDANYTVAKKIKVEDIFETQILFFEVSNFINYSYIPNTQIQNFDIGTSPPNTKEFALLYQVFKC